MFIESLTVKKKFTWGDWFKKVVVCHCGYSTESFCEAAQGESSNVDGGAPSYFGY
jgi:hypothetical protein